MGGVTGGSWAQFSIYLHNCDNASRDSETLRRFHLCIMGLLYLMSSTLTLNINLTKPKQSKLLSVRSNLQICFLAGHTLLYKISIANHWSWSLNRSAFLCCSVMYCYQTYLKRTCTQKLWTKTKNVMCKNDQKVTVQRKSVKIFLADKRSNFTLRK